MELISSWQTLKQLSLIFSSIMFDAVHQESVCFIKTEDLVKYYTLLNLRTLVLFIFQCSMFQITTNF